MKDEYDTAHSLTAEQKQKWYEEHPRWNDLTRNQKRNMRKRLKKRV